MKVCHFTPEERKFIEKLFLVESDIKNRTTVEYVYTSTTLNKRPVTRCTQINIRWTKPELPHFKYLLMLNFRPNTLFDFTYFENGNPVPQRDLVDDNMSESSYKLKIFNAFEKTLKEFDFLPGFESRDLVQFVFRNDKYLPEDF